MLDIGDFRAKTCRGTTRRAFLRTAASAASVFGVAGSTAVVQAAKQGRAKSVVFIWLWGGPSHIDTLDPKPDAPSEYRGPFATIETQTSGLRFTELLPKLAQRSKLFNVIRSHMTFAPGHPDAGTYGLTGFPERPEPVHPNFGSIIAKYRGHRGNLPPFLSVGRGIPRDVVRIVDGYGGGKLGKAYDPFLISCDDQGRAELPSLQLLGELNPLRVQNRSTLLELLNQSQRQIEQEPLVDWQRSYQHAYQLIMQPEARTVFDLTRESQKTRDRYGATTFGQSCLLGRRLVEAEVPYIQINWSEYVECMTPQCDFGWDTHIYNFELLQDRHCPIFDRALSAFFDDLNERGLLETTLVAVMGEFGRTPRISNRAARDHWPQCYASIWAGAGLPTGQVIGASDRLGEHPASNPITPLMVGTTLAELAGLNTQTRAELSILDGGTVIQELVS